MDEFRIRFEPTPKQAVAWQYLHDQTTTELLFGGGAGGGKSKLGCVWLAKNCLQYPGSRWLLGRAILKTIKATTLLTMFEILREWSFKAEQHYHYNSMDAVIRFWNGSEIYLKDLFAYPSDPEFDQLGSSEFTGAFVDEGSQISEKAKNIVIARLRYRITEFGLKPKLLICSNPTKTFLYRDFYLPWKEGALPQHRQYVQALAKDNPHLPQDYLDNLTRLDENSKQRLLYGNWEYDDDPSKLVEYEKILDLFTNPPQRDGNHYISCDAARFGGDTIATHIINGWHLERTITKKKQSTTQTALDLAQLAADTNTPRSNIIIDEDGVGGGVLDQLKGAQGFQNGSKPIPVNGKDQNYANLKTQCYYILADRINRGQASAYPEMPDQLKTMLVQELEQVKRKNADKDAKLELVDKKTVKENLGRSPDLADALMMRAWFDLKKRGATIYGYDAPGNPERGPDAQLARFLRGA